MANVAVDAIMAAGNQGDTQAVAAATSISSTGITVGATAKLLVIVFTWQGASPPTAITVTFNGVAATQRAFTTASAGTNISTGVYTLVNPAAGAQTLAANWTGSSDCYMSAISFTNADTTTGVATGDSQSTTAGSSPTSLAMTSSSDGATVVVQGCNGDEATATQTKFTGYAGGNPGYAASYALGGSSNTHQFTNASGTSFALSGVHVIAGAAGGPALLLPMTQRPANTLLRM